MSDTTVRYEPADPPKRISLVWGGLLLIWFLVLCFVPDPKPLGAPDWAVKLVCSVVGVSEAAGRAGATLALRAAGAGLLALLLSLTVAQFPLKWAAPITLVGASVLVLASLWVNLGYFPIYFQTQLAIASVIVGSLVGMVLRRSTVAMIILILFTGGLFVWGTSTGISDDLYELAAATGRHILDQADEVSDGDEGFGELMQVAIAFAEDNSHRSDSIEPNKAAILALGVILGEERVAKVAGRPIDVGRKQEMKTLCNRITLRGRNDLSRHFWVSASLAVLSDESRSMSVGIAKEMMDATAGGSGFSFVDLTADRAGTLFTLAATKNNKAAKTMQLSIRDSVDIADVMPEITDLPEGITATEFQEKYGGLGGTETNRIVQEIQRRLKECRRLEFQK